MKDATFSDLLIQFIIKIENQFMDLSDSSWQDFTDTGKSTGSFIYFLSTRVDFSFTLHKLEKFSANPSKVHF